jgi:hypothetical protein
MNLEEWKALQARPDKEPASLTCPRCGKTSHNPNDVREAYCGNCHTNLRDIAGLLISFQSADDLQRARRLGYVCVRTLEDGRFLGVELDLHGGAFLKLCSGDDPHSLEGVDDHWQYEELAFAIVAAGSWEPTQQSEPFGFYRHPQTGRRRPFGNPEAEYRRA